MARTMMTRMAEAKAAVPEISPSELQALMGSDGLLIVDVRDHPELSGGKVAGALHVTRGMLEFRADPALPSHDPAFATDKTVVVYCASGGRSALAGQTLLELGYTDVRNLGGFKGWVDAGGAVEPV
ncbi:MAG: rhodanese-like domain-containing protein [Pseudomonadota bacterium]